MAKPSRLFRVYFYYPARRTVVYIDETVAVSRKEAASNVRWNRFGQLSIEALMTEKGIKIEAAQFGSHRDLCLQALACGGKMPAKPRKERKRISSIREKQMFLPGLGQNAQLL